MCETGAVVPRLSSHLWTTGRAGEVRRLVALPTLGGVSVGSVRVRLHGSTIPLAGAAASIERVGMIRDQPVAVVSLDLDEVERLSRVPIDGAEISIELSCPDEGGPAIRNTGPFTRACERSILNYTPASSEAPRWLPPGSGGPSSRSGTVTYCATVADCAASGVDVLFLVASQLAAAPAVRALATHHAVYLGLNVGIVSVGDLDELTADGVRGFIRDVYETDSAAHFGDGHLGFVVLIGDVYADDNATVMIPSYNGYGGNETASDHYYACVSGDDDFEDVMIGRIPAGNLDELSGVVSKTTSYMPFAAGEPWHDRVLLVGGLFYTIKDDYVRLFDEYESLIPESVGVDRIYRHDYGTDQACALDVVDAFNRGYLLVDYAGDGWISSWYHTLLTTHIGLMENLQRLPIVLSMACMTGWMDNTTSVDGNGSYDCFAEQIVNARDGGAVACLAAPRSSDGGMFRTLTKKIYEAAFDQDCVFIGELFATAKLLHLQDGDDVDYTRHFNLFGDPALVFGRSDSPSDGLDLAVRGYQSSVSPEMPRPSDDVTVSVGVSNESALSAAAVTVRLTETSENGTIERDIVVPSIGPWATETAEFVIPSPDVGAHEITVAVDPDGEIDETVESNNAFTRSFYVYPMMEGFPVQLPAGLLGPCIVHLSGAARHIVVPDGDGSLWAIDAGGEVDWSATAYWGASSYGPEIAAAVGDLDGDQIDEVVGTKRMGIAAVGPDGSPVWTANTDDPVGFPILADADSDGDLDIVASVHGLYGSPSKIIAIDEDGDVIWTHQLPSGVDVTTTPAAGDFDLDGRIDIVYGASDGSVSAVSCDSEPPAVLWGPVSAGASRICAVALADVDGDGLLEVVVTGERVSFLNAESGTPLPWNVSLGSEVVSLALGDLDGDGSAEAVVGTADGTLAAVHGGSTVWTASLSGTPGSSAAIADVDGDGSPEVLVGTSAGRLDILSSDGNQVLAPIPLSAEAASTPFVADLDGDDAPDIAVACADGRIYALSMTRRTDEAPTPWCGLGRGPTRSGVQAQPLEGDLTGDLVFVGSYVITNDLRVQPGATLTIAPECRIEFAPRASVHVEIAGTMYAPGRPGGEIVFTPASPSRGEWGGIEVLPGGAAILASCHISGAANGLLADRAAVVVTDCLLRGSEHGGKLEHCNLYALDTTFSAPEGTGLELDGGAGTILGCTFENSATVGLECNEAQNCVIRRCTFTGTTAGDGAIFSRGTSAEVDSCSFTGNWGNGALVKSSAPNFHACEFSDNGGNGLYLIKNSLPWVGWSLISGNQAGVVCETGASVDLGSDINPFSGYNAIHGNAQAAVVNHCGMPAPVKAKKNWWGCTTPDPEIFEGSVNYSQWLTEPPADWMLMAGIEEEDVPRSFRLDQNSPNPFNPSTTIAFDVPASGGNVDVRIYDAGGRLVRVLWSGPASPGRHAVGWDGTSDDGRPVAGGVYFVRMTAPSYVSSRKLTLLK